MTTSELTLHVITPFSVITQLMNILEEPILLRFIFVATILARNTLLGTIVICRVAKYQRYHTHSVRLSSLTKQQHIKILHDESYINKRMLSMFKRGRLGIGNECQGSMN
jgi:hypothetical protein